MEGIINKILKASLMVLCLVLISPYLQAKELSEYEVRAAVETWVRYVTADARPDAVIERMEPYKVKGKTVAYIAYLGGSGFCLCGADDLVLPVYLYNPKGTYNPKNPNYQYILWEIETRLKYLSEGLEEGDPKVLQYEKALSERAAFWQELIAGRIPTRIEDKYARIEPMMMILPLKCKWHQGSPYNDECPLLTPPDERTVVGCGATGAAQIMYYWKWPNTGVGNDTVYYNYRWRTDWDFQYLAVNPDTHYFPGGWGNDRLDWTPDYGGRLWMTGYWDGSVHAAAINISGDSDYLNALDALWNRLTPVTTTPYANFGTTSYDWSLIGDVHSDPPDVGDAEVAKLCYHIGIASEMDYGVWASGCALYIVQTGIVDHFRYDPDNAYGVPDINIMTEEIQWLRPLAFSGCSAPNSCHMFAVYGYNKGTDPDRQFLMNMGWGPGSDSLWYSCDSVSFNLYQKHLTRIAPLNVVKFVGDDNPGDGSPNDPYEDIEEAINEAPDNATLIFKAGSDNTFSAGMLVIDHPFTLKGYDATIRKE